MKPPYFKVDVLLSFGPLHMIPPPILIISPNPKLWKYFMRFFRFAKTYGVFDSVLHISQFLTVVIIWTFRNESQMKMNLSQWGHPSPYLLIHQRPPICHVKSINYYIFPLTSNSKMWYITKEFILDRVYNIVIMSFLDIQSVVSPTYNKQ